MPVNDCCFFLNHDPHVSYYDLEIVGDYCREWNSHTPSLKPRDQLGHEKELGLTYVQKESSVDSAPCKENSRAIPSITGKTSDVKD